MGKLVERRKTKVNYKEIVLKTIFLSSVLSVAVLAPNALKLFDYLKKKDQRFVNFYIKSNLNKMATQGFVVLNKTGLELTNKGQKELLKFQDFQINKTKKWDGLWTVVSFDFFEKKKLIRDAVRFQLKRIGFIQLQKSVWVFPYDCPELIYLIKTEWKLKDELVYIRAKYISREKKLKEYFDL